MPPGKPPTREEFKQEIENVLMNICIHALQKDRHDGDIWMWIKSRAAMVVAKADELYDRLAPQPVPIPPQAQRPNPPPQQPRKQ